MPLPPFPVDDATLDLLDGAIRPGTEAARSSVGELLDLIAELAGTGDPESPYHTNDVIGALLDEVRRLRGPGRQPFSIWYRSLTPDGKLWCESSDPDDFLPAHPGRSLPDLTFQRRQQWLVRGTWEPWTPPTEETAK